jgi:two-component system, chemotaxis family, chemotaxis protein CheV
MMNNHGILLESGTNEMELLTVLVDNQPFGMNVAKVKSIQQYKPELVTTLPEAIPGVAGMFLYRNKTIPLLDLAKILEIELKKDFEREIVVVTEFNNAINCFKVQGVKRIYRLSWKDFSPFDSTFESNAYCTGSVHLEDSEILVLDLEHILSEIFPDLVIEDVRSEALKKKDSISRKQLEIIFAEDSPTMRRGVILALKNAGFENIADFTNGEQALAYIMERYKAENRHSLENVVLISDIEMPRMDGLTLCRSIKQDPDLNTIHVIMFSSLINSQMVAKCEKVNADRYVTKPETNQLIQILDGRCR